MNAREYSALSSLFCILNIKIYQMRGYEKLPLHVGYAHNVGKHTGCRNGRPGTVAPNEHGVFAVAFGGEGENVVRTFQIVERMSLRNFLQTNRTLSFGPTSHKAPAFMLAL